MPVNDPLLILLVVIPMMAAPVMVAVRSGVFAWSLSLAVSWGVLATAIALLMRVLEFGPLSYRLGGWDAPWGIGYTLDTAGAFVVLIVALIGAIVLPYAKASVEREVSSDRIYLFYTMLMLCLSGLLGIVVTGDAFNLFVFLEISSLSTYVLISLGKDRRALTSAFRYLIMGTIGATFYIIGVGLMYQMTGSLNMEDLSTLLPLVADTKTILAALAFLTVGISLKLALFPLHAWLPGAYAYAPSAVTAFLAATATKVSVYVLLRIYFSVFGQVDVFETFPIQPILIGLAVAGMFVASLVAIWQDNIKRMLAYSSVAQIGYIVLGIALATESGLTAGIVHLLNHALVKGAAFMAVGMAVYAVGAVTLKDFEGLGKRAPATMLAFVVAGLGLIGVPMTAGFVSKWQLVTAVLEAGYWPLAGLILISSLFAVVYVWRVIEVAYLRSPPVTEVRSCAVPLPMMISTWVLALASVVFGIWGTGTLELARMAAQSLMGGY